MTRRCLFFAFSVAVALALSGCGTDGTSNQETVNVTEINNNTLSTIGEENTMEDDGKENFVDDDETTSTASKEENNMLILNVNGTELTAIMEENSSVTALMELLAEGPLTIEMSDYASMEKVGNIGTNLPRNDEQITTEAGDLILYLGNSFVIYYAPNSWSLTRLGKIQNVTADELKSLLGDGDVTVILSLPE